MAAENHNKAMCEFSRVRAVTTGWIVDFMFLSLCRRFKEGSLRVQRDNSDFRGVMHGEQLDVQFEENEDMFPLMSAAKIWSDIKHTVADQRLFRDILELLFVQNLCSKVSSMVTKEYPHDPLLNSYSFTRLLETVKTYLDAYLEKNPSDYLVKVSLIHKDAAGVAGKREIGGRLDADDLTQEDVTQDDLTQDDVTQDDDWEIDSCRKPFLSVKRVPENGHMSQVDGNLHDPEEKKSPQKWTHKLDRHLKRGVKRHGVGKWAQMLVDLDLDFEGRTGVMLKTAGGLW
ncbi:hypothetical protein F7725_028485 [Dissostichus mawsoni]|uniref:Uncharacterized protein n=1 Tax=Dissostichus mawsoni TaxID=36200 RepID=A0A7J5XH10_DISMA|nr:hypothetical protein F7725_028485 [Dissostichus mawsoni]